MVHSHRSVNACYVPLTYADGMAVTTIEALQDGSTLHPIQSSFVSKAAAQCGFWYEPHNHAALTRAIG
jgi:aerobic-type carbon monoxide dehydrogenase small subunit (CoxS/CutS family)